MKKVLLVIVILVFGFSGIAQISNFTKASTEVTVGTTEYDWQTFGSQYNRIYLTNDGKIGLAWIMGTGTFADRGTGYNFYNGTTWGTLPTIRVESVKTAYPSLCQIGAGEIFASHNGTTGLVINQRPAIGTGAWTESILLGPVNSHGGTSMLWPRMMVNGNSVHILALTDINYMYQGIKSALVYYRSTDGGITWDKQGVVIPGLDSTIFKKFNSDTYSWAPPKGDTIAFAVSGVGVGLILMKSFDNGETWNKTIIFDFPYKHGNYTWTPCFDASVSLTFDTSNNVHLVCGRMYIQVSDSTTGNYSYNSYTDGLLYWTEGMGALDTAKLADFDWLEDNGYLIGCLVLK